jgi:hypothetical protein
MSGDFQRLGSDLLGQAIAFGRDRLGSLAGQSADGLLAALAPGADPAQLAGAASDVDADLGRARLALQRIDIGQPADAAADLADALRALNDACTAIAAVIAAAGDAQTALLKAVNSVAGPAADAIGGVLAQLGLRRLGDWTVGSDPADGSPVLTSQFGNDAPTRISGLLTVTRAALLVRCGLGTGRLTLTFSADAEVSLSGDALVGAIAAGARLTTTVSVTVDSADGLTVGAGQDTRTHLTGTISAGAVELRDLAIGPSRDSPSAFEITSSLAGKLIALDVLVDGVGLLLAVDASAAVPIAAQTLEPAGAGVTVNADMVRGGGTLDQHGGSYTGTLEVRVGPVDVKAIGQVETKPALSLVLLFFSEFGAPVELGFGFSLDGVGGLLVAERGLSSDALLAGIHDGTADALLFPSDLSRVNPAMLEAVFPPRPSAIAVGPAFKIGWGSPVEFLMAKVGIVLVLPDPKIVLIGAVRVAVPSPALPIVDLNASVFGEVTPDRLLVIAGLAGSRLAGFALSGDFGVLVRYGSQPVFAVSAGGFHPGYSAPGELSGLRRVVIDMSPPVLLSLRAEAYVALTSNAFMLGARLELDIDFVVASAHGYLSFDAIVLWAPFHFAVDLSAHIDVRFAGETFAGITLALHIEGPGRWIAHGTATLELFFLPDVHLEVGPIEWGGQGDVQPAQVSPLALLKAELAGAGSWQALPPSRLATVVTLRDAVPGQDALFAHPLGGVVVRQRAIPLQEPIQLIGGHPVSEHVITLGGLSIEGSPPAGDDVSDLFAPGEYFALTDEQKLSQPAFSSYRAGKSAAGLGATSSGTPRQRDYGWETHYPNRADLQQAADSAAADSYTFPPAVVPHVLAASPAGVFQATRVTRYQLRDRGKLTLSAAP